MPEAAYGDGERLADVHHRRPRAFGADREAIRLALEAEDIEARPLWKPMHLQPIFAVARTFGGDVSAPAVRARALPAERLGAHRRRSGPGRRDRARVPCRGCPADAGR